MKLLVGLGNPGPQYETTRHNAGFLMVDLIAEKAGISWEGGTNRFGGEIAKGTVLGQAVALLKPMTFMNLSGRSVGEVMRFFKVPGPEMVVFYDDLDVPAGKVRAREGGGHGGHNGVRSIIDETGIADFHRMKLGIGRPLHTGEGAVTGKVLGRMSDEELLALQGPMFDETMVRLKGIFDKVSALKNP